MGGFVKGLENVDIITKTILSAIAGGTASVIGGGKFANGAMSAAFIFMFNEMALSKNLSGTEIIGKIMKGKGVWDKIMGPLGLLADTKTKLELIRILKGGVANYQWYLDNNPNSPFYTEVSVLKVEALHDLEIISMVYLGTGEIIMRNRDDDWILLK